MSKKTKTEYEILRDKWYAKLKNKGFVDIEQDEDRLKSWSSKISLYHTSVTWESKVAYYNMADNFLRDYKFESNLDKVIWEYHTHAISIRNIVKLLNKTKVIKTDKSTVGRTIKKMSEAMKKMYLSNYSGKYE